MTEKIFFRNGATLHPVGGFSMESDTFNGGRSLFSNCTLFITHNNTPVHFSHPVVGSLNFIPLKNPSFYSQSERGQHTYNCLHHTIKSRSLCSSLLQTSLERGFFIVGYFLKTK